MPHVERQQAKRKNSTLRLTYESDLGVQPMAVYGHGITIVLGIERETLTATAAYHSLSPAQQSANATLLPVQSVGAGQLVEHP